MKTKRYNYEQAETRRDIYVSCHSFHKRKYIYVEKVWNGKGANLHKGVTLYLVSTPQRHTHLVH
jgi:hypothetical protein